jgi:hypothetical protein
VFGNRAIANVALRSQFGPARFHGRFFGSAWPRWRGGVVIGWIGPLFWPYAYYDLFDYVYWPYAYDDFWPYAYDDVYYGIYGNYAYVPPGGETKPETSDTGEMTALSQPETRETSETPETKPDPSEFVWSDEDIVIHGQPAVGAYVTVHNIIALRAEGTAYTDDSVIIIAPANVPRIIAKLRALLAELEEEHLPRSGGILHLLKPRFGGAFFFCPPQLAASE